MGSRNSVFPYSRFMLAAAALLAALFLCFNAGITSFAAGEGIGLDDGVYSVNVVLEGGSGRAEVTSPTQITVTDGRAVAVIIWSSANYDYMIVDQETYYPVNTEGNSAFEIPVDVLDEPIAVIADTTAMSTPHEIEYTLTFSLASNSRTDFVPVIIVIIVVVVVFEVFKRIRRKRFA